MKLQSLTPDQQKVMAEVKKFWLDNFFSCTSKIDEPQAIASIGWMYQLAGKKKPIVLFVDSPMACQYAVAILKRLFKDNQMQPLRDQVRDQVRAQVGAQVRDQVRDQVGDQVRDQVGDQVWAQVGAQVRDQVRDQVGAQVGDQVGDQVWAQVGAQVGDQVRAQVGAQVGAQVWDQVEDQVWDQVWDQVGAQVGAQVEDQVWDQVWAQVRDQVRAQVRAQVGAQVGAQVEDQVWDQVWAQVRDQVRAQVGAQVGAQVEDQVWDQVRAQVGAQVRDQVRAQVWDQVWDQVRDQVWDQVWAQVGAQVRDQVRAQVWDQVWDQVRDQVWDQVWAQVWAQVRAQVEDQVEDQVRDQPIEFERFAYYGNVTDYGWVSFYDFFTRIGIINHEGFNSFKKLLLTGVYDMIQLNGFCIVSRMPTHISRNNNNRLHGEGMPAINFADGYEGHYWNGVRVEKQWVENPDSVTRETIITEKNAERRRCIREIIGTKKYASLLDLVEIDRDHVNNQDVILYRTAEPDDLINEHIHYVKVICHSTMREYFLCIPKEAATNAWGAVAWTFGKNKKEYKPLIET
jgi:hypothetical protein